ncbi:MAG: TetR/AcrR family transcriptional regulator [Bacteroidota bacterium]|nr:TetR/AcrR family transcriptional regulator [Bacteroidota bacterium]
MAVHDKQKKYIHKALDVFRYEGLRLSLDEVADKMGVTKKTLYNHFQSKDVLLCQCVQSLMVDLRDDLHTIFSGGNTIGNLREAFAEIDRTFGHLSPIFFYDMKKMYPDYFCTEHTKGFGFFREDVLENLKKGIQEGLYRDNLDVDFISEYLTYATFSFYFNKLITTNHVAVNDFFRTTVEYNLLALVSDKGRQLL